MIEFYRLMIDLFVIYKLKNPARGKAFTMAHLRFGLFLKKILKGYILLFLMCLLMRLSLPVHAQDEIFEAKNKEIVFKNKIKSQTQMNHSYTDGVPSETGYKNAYMSYDEKGNMTEVITYKADGKVFSMESYKFDEAGRQIGYVRFDASRNQIVYKKAFKLNAKGDKLAEAGFDGQSNYKNEFKYEGDKLVEIQYSVSEILVQTRKFSYNGNTRTINIYKNDGTFEFSMSQTFDDRENLIEDIEFQPDGKTIARKYQYKYNAANKKTEEIKYEFGNLVYKKEFEYSPAGDILKIVQTDASGTSFETNIYEYDASGRLLKESYRKKPTQQFSTREYKYDEKGICISIDSYYATYKYKVLFKYTYEYF